MVLQPPRNLPPTISSSWNRARRTFPHFRRTSLSILGILVALVDPRTTIIGNVDVLRDFRSPLLQRGEQCQGTRAARANVIGPTRLWLRGFCFREQLATLLSEIWRNPCTIIHRDTEGRALSRTFSPLTRHADATVPDLQLTRDAARRVCASLAPAHRILTPLRSWHPRSLSHPSSLPLLASTIPATKIEKRRKIVSLFGFFLLLLSLRHRSPRCTLSASSSPSISTRSHPLHALCGHPSFCALPQLFLSTIEFSMILSRFTCVPLPWTCRREGSSSLFGSFSPLLFRRFLVSPTFLSSSPSGWRASFRWLYLKH